MILKEFVDYITLEKYICLVRGNDKIDISINSINTFPVVGHYCKNSNGDEFWISTKINNNIATLDDCVNIINKHKRDQRDKKISNILK